MQLVAYGAQDIYLTGNPQITFFKVVYRRHTNFSMEAIEQTWNGTSNQTGYSATSSRCSATISRNGDLVHRMYLQVTFDHNTGAAVDNIGSVLIKDVEVEIGGQKIDKHSGDWMESWAQLTEPNPSSSVLDGSNASWGQSGTLFQKMSGMGGVKGVSLHSNIENEELYIPLQFWFCRNPGLALPLIALQYHEVKVILNWQSTVNLGLKSNTLFCDYIYLDTDERRRFAQVSHEYLIEQVQEQTWTTSSNELNFNHPVKELVWNVKRGPADAQSSMGVASAENNTFQLKLNGHDRFAARNTRYFTRTQVWEHHSGAGGLDTDNSRSNDSIGVYSFALKPEEHQPSGTCNFSRIDNAQLVSASTRTLQVYAVNYNVLRIMSGMGGLAYSN